MFHMFHGFVLVGMVVSVWKIAPLALGSWGKTSELAIALLMMVHDG